MDDFGEFHSADWYKMKFYISEKTTRGYRLEGCIVDENNKILQIVRIGAVLPDQTLVEMLWNFIVIYMHEGPETLYPQYYDGMELDERQMFHQVTFCNDIDEKREEPKFSCYRVMTRDYGSIYVNFLSWITLKTPMMMLGRIIAMKNCKVPIWPEWIKAENQIKSNDHYIVDAEINQYFYYNSFIRRIRVNKPLPEKFVVKNNKISVKS